jgi:DNA-binding transcriptional LysR family regulator
MINPDFIRTFVSLAETRHFTRTARLLHMTQPGVTQHLKKLEDHFGVPLVERSASEVILTEAGRRLEQFGAKLALDHEKLQEAMRLDDPYAGRVRMSSPGSWGLLLFDVMIRCAKKHPNLRVDLTASPSVDIANRVINDQIDIGYSTIPSNDPRLSCTKIHTEGLWIVVPPTARPKTLEDYKNLGLVWHPDLPFLLDRVFEPCFKDYRGVDDFPIRCSINQMNRILDPVEAGIGFSVLPSISVKYYSRGRKIRTVKMQQCSSEQMYRLALKRRKMPQRVSYVEDEFFKELARY